MLTAAKAVRVQVTQRRKEGTEEKNGIQKTTYAKEKERRK
jgi:hypothetical protein